MIAKRCFTGFSGEKIFFEKQNLRFIILWQKNNFWKNWHHFVSKKYFLKKLTQVCDKKIFFEKIVTSLWLKNIFWKNSHKVQLRLLFNEKNPVRVQNSNKVVALAQCH